MEGINRGRLELLPSTLSSPQKAATFVDHGDAA
jgi:hypothetical protein